ncbi:hypothetical protein SAMN05892877_103321 [Rhizobium subbaraonis]|uniref:Uncharacterized protein n=1 Tax=Rhizobium subbaraonis TaxID=908946 RepID=A0A285U569_9HYPH|nr:hypothetical protein SAMN05892877_103321 [Rhizobium subbaraonis]
MPAEVARQGQDVELVADVERGDRLVQKQAIGVLRDQHGEPDALAFAARQRIHQPVCKRPDLGALDGLLDLGPVRRAETPQSAMPGIAAECYQRANEHSGRYRRVPGQIGKPAGEGAGAAIRQRLTLEADLAGRRLQLPADQFQQGGFARAVMADQCNRLPGRKVEGQRIQQDLVADGIADIAQGKDRRSVFFVRACCGNCGHGYDPES